MAKTDYRQVNIRITEAQLEKLNSMASSNGFRPSVYAKLILLEKLEETNETNEK